MSVYSIISSPNSSTEASTRYDTSDNDLIHFLSDLYSMELQALAQLVSAPEMTNDPALASDFKIHHTETEGQAERVRTRLEALGGSPSAIKDAIMKLGGKAFLLFAKLQPETPGNCRLRITETHRSAGHRSGYNQSMRRPPDRDPRHG